MMKRERWLQYLMVCVLVGLLVVSAFVATGCGADWALESLGAKDENDALKFLGAIMGGVLVALNVVVGHRRAKAMEDAASAQAKGMERAWVTHVFTERCWLTHVSGTPSSRERACGSAI